VSDQIPWRLKLVAGTLAGAASGYLLTGVVTGFARPWDRNTTVALIAVLLGGLIANRGLRRSPAVIRARLKELFRASDEPDLVKITGVLSNTGEHKLFIRHRETVDRFMRGMMTEREFYGAMHELVFEK